MTAPMLQQQALLALRLVLERTTDGAEVARQLVEAVKGIAKEKNITLKDGDVFRIVTQATNDYLKQSREQNAVVKAADQALRAGIVIQPKTGSTSQPGKKL